jgi:hypothetical protein
VTSSVTRCMIKWMAGATPPTRALPGFKASAGRPPARNHRETSLPFEPPVGITKRFDAGDPEPVFFGSHLRTQAVLVPIATWEKLLAHAEDELDRDHARRRLADHRPWLSEEEPDAAVTRTIQKASGRETA